MFLLFYLPIISIHYYHVSSPNALPAQCGGVSKVSGKYYTNTGYGIVSQSGAKVWQKGGTKVTYTIVTYTWGYV